MVSIIEEEIKFEPLLVVLKDINAENITELKLSYVREFSYYCLMTPNHMV